jgi:hypothetical protein
MGLFEWGDKSFAKGIARAMIRGYKLFKADDPSLSERELIKLVLTTRPGRPASELFISMDDLNFWQGVAGGSFKQVVYILIRMEYVDSRHLESESEFPIAIFNEVLIEEFSRAGL